MLSGRISCSDWPLDQQCSSIRQNILRDVSTAPRTNATPPWVIMLETQPRRQLIRHSRLIVQYFTRKFTLQYGFPTFSHAVRIDKSRQQRCSTAFGGPCGHRHGRIEG